MDTKRKLPPVIGLLYTHNPFYLISTCFVLYALKQAFHPESGDYLDPWILMAALCGFTLLSTVTAWVVVKFGKVWEDARSIVLIVVLMFLAISVSFDELLNLNPERGLELLLFGFCFSIAISEGLLRGLKIRFPAIYRIPFYLLLGLFFAAPYFVSPEVTQLSMTSTRWRIALFPAVAGILTLSLIPAVRKGSAYLNDNGTPWKWPLFPWTLFGFLAFAVVGRSYYLSISFDESSGPLSAMYSAFGLFHLIPFALAAMLVLLEIGIVERTESLRKTVLVFAGLVPVLAIPYRLFDPTFSLFHAEFTRTLAAPLFLSVWAVCGFYVYAWIRGVRNAEGGIVVMLLIGCIVGPNSTTVWRLIPPQLYPLAILCGMQFGLALRRKSSLHCFSGVLCLAGLLAIGLNVPSTAIWNKTLPANLILLGTIITGEVFRDRAALQLKRLGAVALPPISLLTAMFWQSAGISEMFLLVYLLGMTVLPLGLWYFTRDRWHFYSGLANVAAGSGGLSWMGYRYLKYEVGANIVEPLCYGTACFLVAVLISAHKAGAFRKMFAKKNGSHSVESEIVARE